MLLYSLAQSLLSYAFLFLTQKTPLASIHWLPLSIDSKYITRLPAVTPAQSIDCSSQVSSPKLQKTLLMWILDIPFLRKALLWRIIHLPEMQSGMLSFTTAIILDMTSDKWNWERSLTAEHHPLTLRKFKFRYSPLTYSLLIARRIQPSETLLSDSIKNRLSHVCLSFQLACSVINHSWSNSPSNACKGFPTEAYVLCAYLE